MRQRTPLLWIILCIALITSACGENTADTAANEEYPYGYYDDDRMIGTVREVKSMENIVVVDISEWEKRDAKGPGITSEGYSYKAKVTEGTVIKYEDGTEASINTIKNGQKVMVRPPRGNDFEGRAEEIVLLEMTYEEKYSRLLSHVDGVNIVVMYRMGKNLPDEMQEQMYEKAANLLEGEEKRVVAAWIEYDENYVVDFQKELDIQQFPVILVFNTEELIYKTYSADELYDFFQNLNKQD